MPVTPLRPSLSPPHRLVVALLMALPGLQTSPNAQSAPPLAEDQEAHSEIESQSQAPTIPSPFWANHFSIFQGPSLTQPSAYQPDILGEPDPSRPIAFRNFTTLGWQSNSGPGIAATFAWAAQAGDRAGLVLKDPALRFYHSQLSPFDGIEWYSDIRFHFAAGPESQMQAKTLGVQNFNSFTLQFHSIPVWGGLWLSARWNHYRAPSNAPIWEFYIAPNINWGVSDDFTLSVSLEENAGIWSDFTQGESYGSSDPWYIETALTWRLSPRIELMPLFNLSLTRQTRLQSIALGLGLSWNLL